MWCGICRKFVESEFPAIFCEQEIYDFSQCLSAMTLSPTCNKSNDPDFSVNSTSDMNPAHSSETNVTQPNGLINAYQPFESIMWFVIWPHNTLKSQIGRFFNKKLCSSIMTRVFEYRIFALLSACTYIPTGRKSALNSEVRLTTRCT